MVLRKIAKCSEESDLLIEGLNKIFKNETK